MQAYLVLTPPSQPCRIAGEYDTTQSAASILLAGFTLSVQAAFQAGEAEGE
jgi:hypothetical protein